MSVLEKLLGRAGLGGAGLGGAGNSRPLKPNLMPGYIETGAPVPWYYVWGDKPVGPLSEEEMRGLVYSGALTFDSPVWCAELPDWTPLGHTRLGAVLGQPQGYPPDQPPGYWPGGTPAQVGGKSGQWFTSAVAASKKFSILLFVVFIFDLLFQLIFMALFNYSVSPLVKIIDNLYLVLDVCIIVILLRKNLRIFTRLVFVWYYLNQFYLIYALMEEFAAGKSIMYGVGAFIILATALVAGLVFLNGIRKCKFHLSKIAFVISAGLSLLVDIILAVIVLSLEYLSASLLVIAALIMFVLSCILIYIMIEDHHKAYNQLGMINLTKA
ncbi:MAG: DUF4339 domain-containing protein [Deltaproteobacteria bacterium]|jgi:hypothetical protein|nr:DUF4339 domain-containing protein [Deltaproteobacteria bacterium]